MSGADQSSKGASEGTHAAGAVDQGGRDRGGSASAGALPATVAAEDQRLDGLLPLGSSPLAPRGVGRPTGSRNRRSDLVAQYLVDRFGDPLTATMSIAGRPLVELVRELRTVASDCGMKLGASVMDIARWQQQCRVDALPYIHAKRAPETSKGDPVVPIIGIGRADTVIVAGGRSLEDAVAKSQQDQMVTVDGREVSHGEMSHDGESEDDATT